MKANFWGWRILNELVYNIYRTEIILKFQEQKSKTLKFELYTFKMMYLHKKNYSIKRERKRKNLKIKMLIKSKRK